MFRKTYISKSPKSSRGKKIAKLDTIFSKFIRQRDCTPIGKCISCGKPITLETSDAGHFHNRAYMSLRYDEQNVNAQCRHCNRFREGNMQGYQKGLVDKIGGKAVDMLFIKRSNLCKLSEVELDLLIDHYKKLLKDGK